MVKKIMDSLMEHDSLFSILIIAIGIFGILMTTYTLFQDDVCVMKRPEAHGQKIVINGDTTRSVYVLEDSTTGMVWIGIPGVNRIRK